MSTPPVPNQLTTSLGTSALHIAGGVIAARTLPVIAKKVSDYIGVNGIGGVLDKVLPTQVKDLSNRCATLLSSPVIWLQTKLLEHGYDRVAFSSWFANVIGPTIEEAVFRLGVQGGITYALTQMGFNPDVAAALSITCASVLFGQSHSPDLNSEQFNATMLGGVVFGVLQNYGNFFEATVAHVLFDSTLNMM